MPKREDIKKLMVVGSGPIIIGQAAEFDYSGTQACKALREEGYKVVLVNSNPATIQTDLTTADTVYIEPLNVETITKIIKKEKPQGIIATMGGQTALNLTAQLHDGGILEENNVEILGTPIWAIQHGEDREMFKELMGELEIPLPRSKTVNNLKDAKEYISEIGFPAVIRPAYTLGGTGGGVVFNQQEFEKVVQSGLSQSMIHQILVEEAILGQAGWGEIEFEVVRDGNDNCITICSMENVDPMGIHTGDSIVIAPALTLNNDDYHLLRSSSIKIIRGLKIEGGCNVQFAFNYKTGEYRIIEVNPRLSRSSALASKATGYPIARVAAKIAVGMSLDEIKNDVTRTTSACFEPSIDYVVVKFPRWPFDKFRTVEKTIGTQMKSTGETMAIGRTFEEAIQKAIRSLEIKRYGLGFDKGDKFITDKNELLRLLKNPTHERIFHIRDAFKIGMSIDEIHNITGINRWFLNKLKNIYDFGNKLKDNFNDNSTNNLNDNFKNNNLKDLNNNPEDNLTDNLKFDEYYKKSILAAKKLGFSDKQIAFILNQTEEDIRKFRLNSGIVPTYKMVDTCAAEFEAATPYLYSTYESEDESNPSDRKKVIIVGGGPIRIGQGIEFDYCCVHSVYALREEGIEALIINNNPETVSTDFDTSDKLYFEPLTYEDVMNIIEKENPYGVILQFGGQTPINMAMRLHKSGVRVLGTSPENIDIAEDRKRFTEVLNKLEIPQAPCGTAFSVEEALKIANEIGYPVLVRPSYVLGGRAMEIVNDDEKVISYMEEAMEVSPEHPVLVDKFLTSSVEIDVDALCDGEDVFIAAIMEHIEEAGIHSGDSACVIPPQTISEDVINTVKEYTKKLALELNVVGLINIQYAVQGGKVFLLEANPRASRTVPFVSKTIGVPLAKIATKIMLGRKLRDFKDFNLTDYREPDFVAVKEAVFPFIKLFGVDPVLSPEMKSTGEVMGIDIDFGRAFYKAQESACMELPKGGNILLSIGRGMGKENFLPIAKNLQDIGFSIYCTGGTQRYMVENGVHANYVPKLRENTRIIDMMKSKELNLVIVIPRGSMVGSDGYMIRRACVELSIPYITTLSGAIAAIKAIKSMIAGEISVADLESYYKVK